MGRHISRRDVLKSTAAIGAGLWLGTNTARAEGPSDKLNIALIGVGGQGGANLRGVRSQNIVALCDVDTQRGGKAFQQYPKTKKFSDFRKMFDAMEKQIDAVVVSTPDHSHFPAAMAALQRGKHLYCEKPMAHSVWETRQMTKFAAEKKVATQLGVQRHTIPNMHRIFELVQQGAIGDVAEVHSWIGGSRGMPKPPAKFPEVPAHLKWDLWLGPAKSRPYSPEYCPYKWRFWWDFGTGETGNWGCHILDIPFTALGLKYPTRVDASGPPVDGRTTPKSMSTSFLFEATGTRPAVKLHWYHTSKPPKAVLDRIRPLKGYKPRGINTMFVGSKGVLLCGFSKRELLVDGRIVKPPATKKTVPDSPGFHKEWFIACKGGGKATCHFDYSGPLTETVLLGNLAYRAGGGFDWDAATLKPAGNSKAGQYLKSYFRKGWEV
jgi:predicted dehydrogenase